MTSKNVYQRLASVMEEVTYIQKERKQGMNYTIVSHDAVTAKVRPALLKHGIVYHPIRCENSHNGNRAECAMTVRFVNIDAPDDFFDVPSFGYGIDPQDKGPGKAMSYAVKYALLKALGLETGDDPDNDSIAHEPAPFKATSMPVEAPKTFAAFGASITSAKTPDALKDAFAAIWKSSLPQDDKDTLKTAYEAKKVELANPGYVAPSFDNINAEMSND
jgi:hypothetical protein